MREAQHRHPQETRPFKDHGHMDVVTLGDFTFGRGVFEPGWALVERRQADRWHGLLPDPAHRHLSLEEHDRPARRRIRGHGRSRRLLGHRAATRRVDSGDEPCVLLDTGIAAYAKPA